MAKSKASKKSTLVTIDGKEYEFEKLSEVAQAQLNNLRGADLRIEKLISELAITRTARQAYAQALAKELGITAGEEVTIQ